MSSEIHDEITERQQRITTLLPEKTDPVVWQHIKNLYMQNMLDYVEVQHNYHAALHEYTLWQENQPIGITSEKMDDEDINGALFACGSYIQLGQFMEENYDHCVELASEMIRQTANNLGVVPLFHMMRGDAYQWQKKYALAYEDFNAALDLNMVLLEQMKEDTPERMMISTSNAALYRRIFDNHVLQHHLREAEQILDTFEKQAKSVDEKYILAQMCADLAQEYHREAHAMHTEDHVQPSLAFLLQALALYNELDDDALCALIHQNIGSTYMCAKLHVEGQRSFENALSLHEISRDENWGPTTLCLAMSYRDQEDQGEFEKLYALAERRFEEFSSSEMFAEFLHEKAAYYWSEGKLDQAKDYYYRSQELYDFLIDPMDLSWRPHNETCENCRISPELTEFFMKLELERLKEKGI